MYLKRGIANMAVSLFVFIWRSAMSVFFLAQKSEKGSDTMSQSKQQERPPLHYYFEHQPDKSGWNTPYFA